MKEVVVWIKCLDILENLEVGDASIEDCLRPGSSSTLGFEELLQLNPELSFTNTLWLLWIFELRSFGTPDCLCYHFDKNITAHWTSFLRSRQEPALAPTELEDFSFEQALEPSLELCFQGHFLCLDEFYVYL